MELAAYPFPAVLIEDGRVLDGHLALRRLVEDRAIRWSPLGAAAWATEEVPWRRGVAWDGEVEAAEGADGRCFQVASVPTSRGRVWQFVEQSARAHQNRMVADAVDALPDAFSITTAELQLPGPQFVFVNRAFTHLMGWSADEILGRTPRVLQGPRTDRAELDRLVSRLSAGLPFHGGAVNYRKTGEPFWNEWNITAVRDQHQVTRNYVTVMRDVTATRVAQHQVQAAATQWASIIDALDANIVMTHESGHIARCNRAFAELLGASFSELVGARLASVLLGPGITELPASMYEPRPTAIRLDRCRGWFAVDGRPVSRDGRVIAWVHTLSNVTPSRQTAEQLGRLAAACEQANDGIAVLDITSRIEYVNPKLAAMLGRDRAELLHLEIGRTGLLGKPADELAHAMTGGSHTVRHELLAQDGRRSLVEVALGRVAGAENELTGYVVIVRDLTERERLWRIAEHASTLGNIGHWLGGLRHELGNPVNSVKMALTVLGSHLPTLTPGDIARLVERAASELGRVEFLLRTLKTFSLYDSLDVEPMAIAPFFERLRQLLEPDLVTARIALVIRVPADLIVECDRRALHQIFVNLLSNAMDAMARQPGQIELEAQPRDGRVEMLVRDHGVGMSKTQIERLFHPFETTKPHGTGLGLVLVQRLVTGMVGHIEVASVEGSGTTVMLSFPGNSSSSARGE